VQLLADKTTDAPGRWFNVSNDIIFYYENGPCTVGSSITSYYAITVSPDPQTARFSWNTRST